MSARVPVLSLLGFFFTLGGYAEVARADCATPPPLIWSYPQDGATDVPTNAVLIFAGDPAAATLDGVLLDRLGAGFSFDLGQLMPETSYSVTLQASDSSGASDAVIEFTTGSGPAERSDFEFPDVSKETCAEIRAWQGCFDTGSPEHFRLTPDSDQSPLAWGIIDEDSDGRRPIGVWPSACGPIELDDFEAGDYVVEELFVDGPGDEVKASIDEDEPSGGCSVGPGGGRFSLGGWASLCVALAFLGRRRPRGVMLLGHSP